MHGLLFISYLDTVLQYNNHAKETFEKLPQKLNVGIQLLQNTSDRYLPSVKIVLKKFVLK